MPSGKCVTRSLERTMASEREKQKQNRKKRELGTRRGE
jgi:hypothetical protein